MVAPLLLAAIPALASLGSGLLGAKATGDAASANQAINQMNLNAADRERLQQLFMAQKIDAESKLGTTDVFGTRTQFRPGEGVVTEASPDIQRLIDASNFEQEQQLTRDAASARQIRDTNANRALDSGLTADSLLQEFLRQVPSETNEIRRTLDLDTSRGFNQGFDQAQNQAFIQALRAGTGSDSLASTIQQTGDQRGRTLASLFSGNRERAEGIKATRDDQSGLANLFNMFATRGAGAASAAPAPSGVGAEANKLTGLFANRLAQSNALQFNAAGRVGGRADFVTPNFSNAVAVGGAGEALSSFLSALSPKISGMNADRGASSGGFGT